MALIHATPIEVVEMIFYFLVGGFVGGALVRLAKKRRGNRER